MKVVAEKLAGCISTVLEHFDCNRKNPTSVQAFNNRFFEALLFTLAERPMLMGLERKTFSGGLLEEHSKNAFLRRSALSQLSNYRCCGILTASPSLFHSLQSSGDIQRMRCLNALGSTEQVVFTIDGLWTSRKCSGYLLSPRT